MQPTEQRYSAFQYQNLTQVKLEEVNIVINNHNIIIFNFRLVKIKMSLPLQPLNRHNQRNQRLETKVSFIRQSIKAGNANLLGKISSAP